MDTFVKSKKIMMNRRLSEVEVGKTVIIKYFEKDEIFLKLMEMGCVPGEIVIVEQVAPLGDPISILVSGYHSPDSTPYYALATPYVRFVQLG